MGDTEQRINCERRRQTAHGVRRRTRAIEHDEQVCANVCRFVERLLARSDRRNRPSDPPVRERERFRCGDGRAFDETTECIHPLEPLDLDGRGATRTTRQVDEHVNRRRCGNAHNG